MWPLLMVSILAMGAVFERSIFLIAEQGRRDPKALKNFFEAIRTGDITQALQISSGSKFFVLRTLGYALEHKESSLASALMFAQKQEIKRFRAGIPILDTVITLAPLLGLLGTVTGMMGSFSLIGGELSAPGAITGGIAEALIATAFGLGIAITALVPFNLLNMQVEKARLEIESAATQLELLMEPPAKPAAAKGNRLKSRPAKVVGKIAWRGRSETARSPCEGTTAMKRAHFKIICILCGLTLASLAQGTGFASEPVKSSPSDGAELEIWNDPDFKKQFVAYYGVNSEVEPRITPEEVVILEKIQPLMARGSAQGGSHAQETCE